MMAKNIDDDDSELPLAHINKPEDEFQKNQVSVKKSKTDQFLLPPSCSDLPIGTPKLAFRAAIVYEFIRRFSSQLRLSPFRFEDFCTCLIASEECSSLLSEVFAGLLRALIKDDTITRTTYCGKPCLIDGRESVSIWFYSLDQVTWPEICRSYLKAQSLYDCPQNVRDTLDSLKFPFVNADARLSVLHCLVDMLLQTQIIRDDLEEHTAAPSSKKSKRPDELCRKCHKSGNLIFCKSCSGLYHSQCAEPSITDTEKEWFCIVCLKHNVVGVDTKGDLFATLVSEGTKLLPHLLIGIDKRNRHYWFVARRIFVEDLGATGSSKVAYYSSAEYVEFFLRRLVSGKDFRNKELLSSLKDWKQHMLDDMAVTKELTEAELKSSGRATASSALSLDLEELSKFERGESYNFDDSGYRLGDEGSHRHYENQYHAIPFSLTVRQQKEESDRRQMLSNRFCVLPPNSKFWIRWQKYLPSDLPTWTPKSLSIAIKSALLTLEAEIPKSNAFFMPAWLSSSLACRWRRAVEVCTLPNHFAIALLVLVSNLRLVAFLPVWYELGGHIRLSRVSRQDRVETKLRDEFDRRLQRKLARQARAVCRRAKFLEKEATIASGHIANDKAHEDSDASMDSESEEEHAVKFSKKIHHTIWKQSGEEYRLTIGGGWYWMRSRRRTKPHQTKMEIDSVTSGSEKKTLLIDSFLQKRLAMTKDVEDQQSAISNIIKPLQEGRRMVDIFLPSLLPLPDNLPDSIRHLPISVATTIEELTEMSRKLAPPTTDTILLRLPKKRPLKTNSFKVHRFQTLTKSTPNVFVLHPHLIKWLARKGGFVDFVPGYIQQASGSKGPLAGQAWYAGYAPRPSFRTAWEYRTSLLCYQSASNHSFSAVAVQLRTLAACLRFDEMLSAPPSAASTNVIPLFVETDQGTTKTRELLKACAHPRELWRFEYLCRIVSTDSQGKESVSEVWLPDSYLQLWEIRFFHERLSQWSMLASQTEPKRETETPAKRAKMASPTTAVMRIPSPMKNTTSSPSQSQEMQELRITQLPDGRFEIKGLLRGQYMVRVPDGSFQLVTLTPAAEAAVASPKSVKKPILGHHPKQTVHQSPQHVKTPLGAQRSKSPTAVDSLQRTPRQQGRSPFPPKSPERAQLDDKVAGLRELISAKRRIIEEAESSKRQASSAIKTPRQKTPVLEEAAIKKSVSTKKTKPSTTEKESPKRTTKKIKAEIEQKEAHETALEPHKKTARKGGKVEATAKDVKQDSPKRAGKQKQAESEPTKGPEVAVAAEPMYLPEEQVDDAKYCICQTPYDPALFYIGCENCEDWFHGSCVGISEELAQTLDVYYCDKCEKERNKAAKQKVVMLEEQQKTDQVNVAEASVTSKKGSRRGQKSTGGKDSQSTPQPPAESGRSSKARTKPTTSDSASPATGSARPSKRATSKTATSQPPSSAAEQPQAVLPATGASAYSSDELYCICRTPYDETEFYIACDNCGEWYHGRCVYIAECESKWIVRWLCARCDENDSQRIRLVLTDALWHEVEGIVTAMQRHKKSWPFRNPVDRTLYPSYYAVIRRPIDLSLIAGRVKERRYATIDQFKYDVLLMFDNCRKFNLPESEFYGCAETLQTVFLERLRAILAKE